MRKLLQLIVLGTLLAAFALPALAQETTAAQAGQQDDSAAKTELYKKFTAAYNRGKEIKKGDPPLAQPGNREAYNQAAKEAYEFAKEYIQKYPSNPDAIFNFQKNYIDAYEKAIKEERKLQLGQLIKDKKFSETFALGRQILADEPNDLGTNYDLARAGLTAALNNPPDESNNAETAKAARKAIQLIESGATFEPGKPIAKKDEILALMNYALGVAVRKDTPGDAVNAFIRVGQLEGPLKSDPWPYYLLAVAYQAKEYDTLAKDFQARCTTQEQRDGADCKALTDRLNLVVDRVIDAYARAIAYSGTNPVYQTPKVEWTKQLTDFYKYRHDGKEDGLTAYIAGIKSQPLPGPLPAATAAPAPTSSSTPATSGSTVTTTPAASTTPAPQATPVSTTTTTTPTAKPATTATTTPKATTAPKTTPKTTPKKKAHASSRN